MMNLAFILLTAQISPPPAARASLDARRAEAYYHFSLGLQARLTGDTETSLDEYRKAQKLDVGSAAIRVETARLLRESGRLDDALAEAKEAVRLEEDNADAHLVLGQIYQLRSDGAGSEQALRRAAAEYEVVVRLQPSDGNTIHSLASLYGQLQEHKDAARLWQLFLALDAGSFDTQIHFDAQVQLGTQLLAAGETEAAATALKKALELQPSVRAYQALGEIYARAQQTDQAILHYRKALEVEPGNLRVHLGLGDILQRAKRYPEALAEAEAVLLADPKNRYALDLKGRTLRDLKDFDKADEAAEQVLAQDASDLKAAYLRVTIAEARRDFPAAAAQLEGILARSRAGEDPTESASNDRVFLIHLGFAYQQQNRYADAAAAFGRAKRVGGEPDAALLGYHAEALLLAKDLDRALTETRAARGKFPDDPDLANLEATVLRDKGDLKGALTVVEAMRKKSPEDPKVLVQVADFYRKARKFSEAEAALRKARELEPKSLPVLFQLGAVLERQKRLDEAESFFREALKLEPDSAAILNYLGYMNADRNVRVEEAVGFLEKALAIDPGSGAYLDSLGWAQYRLNRLEPAEENVRKALERQGSNAVILDHLGDILERRGHVAEAMTFWQRALQGEDEEGELDRAGVERKIREAQTLLHAHDQKSP
jgi:tetratricopeptide (TPR) repeat protein